MAMAPAVAGMSLLERAIAELPVAAAYPRLREVLADGHAVLTAPPGSGKTTLVPLLLLREAFIGGRDIVLVTPRQVAARAAARRMAQLFGCAVGDVVGYHVRWDRRTGPRTRLRVMTEGMLLRQLEAEPDLPGTALVVLDEFHERSLDGDLLLALLLEVCGTLRDDLRLLVMSATLDAAPVSRLLGNAPVVAAQGRQFPVETAFRPLSAPPARTAEFAGGVAKAVRETFQSSDGNLLCFLPGMREQRAVADVLGQHDDADVRILHGSMDGRAQDEVLAPGARRRIILSTPIAQTSLTVEGVDAVVDSGWHRQAVFDADAGVNRLQTRRISRAAAEQRAGRAGRLRPGRCLRLWTAEQHARLPAQDAPEIMAADLAAFALRAATWGHSDPRGLALLDAPPPRALADARALLMALGAVDSGGAVTARGRAISAFPLHPRLAGMLLTARDLGIESAGLWLAAALEDGGGEGLDVAARVRALQRRPRQDAVHRLVADLARNLEGAPPPSTRAVDEAALARLLCAAYPDRIARRRDGTVGRFHCADGGEVRAPETATAAHAEWIVVGHWEAGSLRRARLLATLPEAAIRSGDWVPLQWHTELVWDEKQAAVRAERQQRLGAIVVQRQAISDPEPERVAELLCEAVARRGVQLLPWTDAARGLQARLASLHAWCGAPWPDVSDGALSDTLAQWLPPWIAGMSRLSHLAQLDMTSVLRGMVPAEALRRLDQEAPPSVPVPSGQQVALQYSGGGEPPVLAVKLQALFGLRDGPRVCGGRVPVQIHLLSPAGRPLQVTQDLASFWARGYAEVAREMRGRYPKHPWPEDPAKAQPTMQTQRQQRERGR